MSSTHFSESFIKLITAVTTNNIQEFESKFNTPACNEIFISNNTYKCGVLCELIIVLERKEMLKLILEKYINTSQKIVDTYISYIKNIPLQYLYNHDYIVQATMIFYHPDNPKINKLYTTSIIKCFIDQCIIGICYDDLFKYLNKLLTMGYDNKMMIKFIDYVKLINSNSVILGKMRELENSIIVLEEFDDPAQEFEYINELLKRYDEDYNTTSYNNIKYVNNYREFIGITNYVKPDKKVYNYCEKKLTEIKEKNKKLKNIDELLNYISDLEAVINNIPVVPNNRTEDTTKLLNIKKEIKNMIYETDLMIIEMKKKL